MCFLRIAGSILLLTAMFLGCSEQAEPITPLEQPAVQETGIPNFIVARADSFIISKVGPAFFFSYITYDSSRSRFSPPDTFCVAHPSFCSSYLRYPHYSMVYTFRIPEKAWINEIIEFELDTAGGVILDAQTYGIPDCLLNPSCCVFGIDSSMAVSVARQAGLEQGIKPWRSEFYWYGGDLNKYVWGVSNTLTQSANQSSGRVVVIDANFGTVLQILDWMAIQ